MNRLLGLLGMAFLFAVLTLPAAAEMKTVLKLDKSNPQILRTRFSTYGYRPETSIFREQTGFRFKLPARPNIEQTGVYSYFVLAGDGEATATYELLILGRPRTGYGCSIGLAFDGADKNVRGSIQRVHTTDGKGGYVLQTVLPGAEGKTEEYKFVPTKAIRGRMGLRRIKNELIFLASDDPKEEAKEIHRLPFTDKTIRTIRFFGDPGGSPTVVDARVKDIELRAEEITAVVPEKEKERSRWWLWLILPASGVPLFFLWRTLRRRWEDDS